MNNVEFLQARIDAAQASIVAYEGAILALANGVQMFKLDTGQTVETVTEFDVKRLQAVVTSLYATCATLEARLNGGSVIGGPAW